MTNIKKIHLSKSEAWILESIPLENTHSRLYLADLDDPEQIITRNLIDRKLVRFNSGEFKWLVLTGRGMTGINGMGEGS
jgi:hypothetical protein